MAKAIKGNFAYALVEGKKQMTEHTHAYTQARTKSKLIYFKMNIKVWARCVHVCVHLVWSDRSYTNIPSINN